METVTMVVWAVRHGVLVLVVTDMKAERVGGLSVVAAAPLELVGALVRNRALLGGEGGP